MTHPAGMRYGILEDFMFLSHEPDTYPEIDDPPPKILKKFFLFNTVVFRNSSPAIFSGIRDLLFIVIKISHSKMYWSWKMKNIVEKCL
jgi:hypothetical protein